MDNFVFLLASNLSIHFTKQSLDSCNASSKNISLSERELEPIIGVRNVKTHYNKFKRDVMFTFYDNLYGFEEKAWNLCYNELQQKWITFYSWVPSYSENISN